MRRHVEIRSTRTLRRVQLSNRALETPDSLARIFRDGQFLVPSEPKGVQGAGPGASSKLTWD